MESRGLRFFHPDFESHTSEENGYLGVAEVINHNAKTKRPEKI
jgi:hypothetical protein